MGGSADLTGSNLTKVDTSATTEKTLITYITSKRHIMAAAMNGISLHGGTTNGGTFWFSQIIADMR